MKIEGKEVKVGDYVSFKSDIEQSGEITKIYNNGMIQLHDPYGFKGDYIRGEEYTIVRAKDCWIE